jgi:hypothetical protein
MPKIELLVPPNVWWILARLLMTQQHEEQEHSSHCINTSPTTAADLCDDGSGISRLLIWK